MVITTIFSLQISNVDASTNDEKAKELVSKMTLEEKIGQKLMLSFRSGWTMEDGTKVSSVQNINDEIYQILEYTKLLQANVLFLEPRRIGRFQQFVLDKDYILMPYNNL